MKSPNKKKSVHDIAAKKNSSKMPYRLSPGEVEALLTEERQKRRKQRIIEVRQQAKQHAAKVRQAVKKEYQVQIQKLADEEEEKLKLEQKEKVRKLQEAYINSVNRIGEAHLQAALQESKQTEKRKRDIDEMNRKRAQERHHKAMMKLARQRAEQEQEQTQHIQARQDALDIERVRAADIASRPKPPPDPLVNITLDTVKPVRVSHAAPYAGTYYHIPADQVVVEKGSPDGESGHQAAEAEQAVLDQVMEERSRSKQEREEKARLRHKHALHKERLKQGYDKMLHDLSDLQRADAVRRSQVVAQIPRNIFVPPHKSQEEKREKQSDMEQKFEDMYLANTDYEGNLSLCLEPHPIPPTPSLTESLDITVDEDPDSTTTDHKQPATDQPDTTTATDQTQAKSGISLRGIGQADSAKGGPLKSLFERIKNQREVWMKAQTDGVPLAEETQAGSTAQPHTEQIPDSASTVSTNGPTLTQYSQTTDEVTRGQGEGHNQHRESVTLSGGEVDSEGGGAPARDGVTGSASVTTESTLSQKTISSLCDNHAEEKGVASTLLHPMEEAARARQHPPEHRKRLEKNRAEQAKIQEEIARRSEEIERMKEELALQAKSLEKSSHAHPSHNEPLLATTQIAPDHGVGYEGSASMQYHDTVAGAKSSTCSNERKETTLQPQSLLLPHHMHSVLSDSSQQSDLSVQPYALTEAEMKKVQVYQQQLMSQHRDRQEALDLARADLRRRADHASLYEGMVPQQYHEPAGVAASSDIGSNAYQMHSVHRDSYNRSDASLQPKVLTENEMKTSQTYQHRLTARPLTDSDMQKVQAYQERLKTRSRDRQEALDQARADLQRRADQYSAITSPYSRGAAISIERFHDIELSSGTDNDASSFVVPPVMGVADRDYPLQPLPMADSFNTSFGNSHFESDFMNNMQRQVLLQNTNFRSAPMASEDTSVLDHQQRMEDMMTAVNTVPAPDYNSHSNFRSMSPINRDYHKRKDEPLEVYRFTPLETTDNSANFLSNNLNNDDDATHGRHSPDADFDQQRSGLMSHRQPVLAEFSRQQTELQEQLSEIERQKEEILQRNAEHQKEIDVLRHKYWTGSDERDPSLPGDENDSVALRLKTDNQPPQETAVVNSPTLDKSTSYNNNELETESLDNTDKMFNAKSYEPDRAADARSDGVERLGGEISDNDDGPRYDRTGDSVPADRLTNLSTMSEQDTQSQSAVDKNALLLIGSQSPPAVAAAASSAPDDVEQVVGEEVYISMPSVKTSMEVLMEGGFQPQLSGIVITPEHSRTDESLSQHSISSEKEDSGRLKTWAELLREDTMTEVHNDVSDGSQYGIQHDEALVKKAELSEERYDSCGSESRREGTAGQVMLSSQTGSAGQAVVELNHSSGSSAKNANNNNCDVSWMTGSSSVLSQHSLSTVSQGDSSSPQPRHSAMYGLHQPLHTTDDLQAFLRGLLNKAEDSLSHNEQLLALLRQLEARGAVMTEDERRQLEDLVDKAIASSSMGIMDEPDLTLTSVDLSLNPEPVELPDDRSVGTEGVPADEEASTKHTQDVSSLSLLSFENHEASMAASSPLKHSVHEQWQVPLTESRSPEHMDHPVVWSVENGSSCRVEPRQDANQNDSSQLLSVPIHQVAGDSSEVTDTVAGMSLQEAFAKRRSDFIRTQDRRHQEAKQCVPKTKPVKVKTTAAQQQQAAFSKNLAQWMKSKSQQASHSKETILPKISEKTADDRKLADVSMKERTSRLYNKLEEVQKRKQEMDRKATYAENRQKAKLYHEKQQAARKKKLDSKKK